jgi:hypothetical protein
MHRRVKLTSDEFCVSRFPVPPFNSNTSLSFVMIRLQQDAAKVSPCIRTFVFTLPYRRYTSDMSATYLNTYQAPIQSLPIPNIHLDTPADKYDFHTCLDVRSFYSDRVELRPLVVR